MQQSRRCCLGPPRQANDLEALDSTGVWFSLVQPEAQRRHAPALACSDAPRHSATCVEKNLPGHRSGAGATRPSSAHRSKMAQLRSAACWGEQAGRGSAWEASPSRGWQRGEAQLGAQGAWSTGWGCPPRPCLARPNRGDACSGPTRVIPDSTQVCFFYLFLYNFLPVYCFLVPFPPSTQINH